MFVFYPPKGEVIDLPRAWARWISFAYRIHSKVGDPVAFGARVNGRIVPLDYQLERTATLWEIILGPTSKRAPASTGSSCLKTSNAKSKIRAYLKREVPLRGEHRQRPRCARARGQRATATTSPS